MPTEISKKWIAVDPHTDEIVAADETKEALESRLRLCLQLDPDDFDIVATPKNSMVGSFL